MYIRNIPAILKNNRKLLSLLLLAFAVKSTWAMDNISFNLENTHLNKDPAYLSQKSLADLLGNDCRIPTFEEAEKWENNNKNTLKKGSIILVEERDKKSLFRSYKMIGHNKEVEFGSIIFPAYVLKVCKWIW